MQKPLLIKAKWPLVLATATACGLSQAPQARAGKWEIEPATEMYGQVIRHEGGDPSDHQMRDWYDRYIGPNCESYTLSLFQGNSGYLQNAGRLRSHYRWVRNKIRGSSPYGQDVDDPRDNPTPLYVKLTASATAEACSDIYQSVRDPLKEHADTHVKVWWHGLEWLPLFDKINRGSDTGLSTFSIVWKPMVLAVPTGAETAVGPWCRFETSAGLDDRRDSEGGALTDSVRAQVGYSAPPITLTYAPDPNGLAVDDCSNSNRTLNQYRVTDIIPCSITYDGTDADVVDALSSSADWTLGGGPLLPLLLRGSTRVTQGGNSTMFSPTVHPHTAAATPPSSAPPPPVPGLGFYTDDGLLSFNGAYGERTLTHHVLGEDVTANIALFYPAWGTQHPEGGPIDYDTGRPTAPNWMYYYAQAYQPCPIGYYPNLDNGGKVFSAYGPGDDHVTLSAHAHSDVWRTFVFGNVQLADGTIVLRHIHNERTKGIVSFARLVRHEYAHKQCYQELHPNGGPPVDANQDGVPDKDLDQDGVPDAWEGGVGLEPGTDTAEINTGLGGAGYGANSGDSEAFARIKEQEVPTFSLLDSDWSDEGLNWGSPPLPAPSRCSPLVYTNLGE